YFFSFLICQPLNSILFPYTTLFRSVLLWYRQENICLPAFPHETGERKMVWKLPSYATLHSILTKPIYAGAYAYGKSETRTKIIEDRKSTRLNSSHVAISYAVFCLKK